MSDPHISGCGQVEAPVCRHHPDLADVTPESQPAPPALRREQQRAGHRVGQIVVGPGWKLWAPPKTARPFLVDGRMGSVTAAWIKSFQEGKG